MLLIINNDYIVIYDVRDAFNNNVKSEMISQSNIYYILVYAAIVMGGDKNEL